MIYRGTLMYYRRCAVLIIAQYMNCTYNIIINIIYAILAERFGRCILFYWSSSNCLSSISRNPRTKRRWV